MSRNFGMVRENIIVLVAMNSALLIVGFVKSISGILLSSIELTSELSPDTRDSQKTPGTWPPTSRQTCSQYVENT